MKRSFFIRWPVLVLLAGIILNSTPAQTAAIAAQPTQDAAGYQIGEREADQRVWQEIIQVTDSKGNTSFQTNQAYVETASGLNYWDSDSKQWLESKEEIDAYPGGAIAQYGQQKVIFAGEINSAVAIDMQTSDGRRLQSHVIGLGYYDVASGKSVLIAEVTDSTGQILPPNQVIYTNAFTDVRADVCYTYTKAGFEQDVILRQRPPVPEVFGLSSASTPYADPTYNPSIYAAQAHLYALQAATNYIQINAIFVEYYNDANATAVMSDYAHTSCGWFLQTASTYIEDAMLNMIYSSGNCN